MGIITPALWGPREDSVRRVWVLLRSGEQLWAPNHLLLPCCYLCLPQFLTLQVKPIT